nr:uncharacterized protein LOC113402757 [Vanessa tameamea]
MRKERLSYINQKTTESIGMDGDEMVKDCNEITAWYDDVVRKYDTLNVKQVIIVSVGSKKYTSTAKHPIILPDHSRLTDLIIDQAHITTLHGGPRLTLSFIRENYWILSGKRTVKRQLRQCIKCRRFSPKHQQQIMADLPRDRVTPSRPFTHTGVDFLGHVELKPSKGRGMKTYKGYVAVFVCLATKTVHLELVSDLSTPAFLAAFRRFCARRGIPRRIYSDNGTNFIGAKRALDREFKKIINNINNGHSTLQLGQVQGADIILVHTS